MTFSELPRHHAILITHEGRTDYADMLWNELSASSAANRYFNQTVLDIETAREIISWAQTPYNDDRVALISFASAGIPAQNAMLKILEEPNEKTRFVIITTNRNNLLDTVLSRLLHVHMETKTAATDAKLFLSTASASRMKLPFVTELLAKTDEEGRKAREHVKAFILSLSEALRTQNMPSRYVLETLEIASYASDPSASGKALLEYLSLLLPVIK